MRTPMRSRHVAVAILAAATLLLAASGLAQASRTRPARFALAGPVVQASMILNLDVGSTVSVSGLGVLSRCVTDASDTTYQVRAYSITVPFGYTAESCGFENSVGAFVVRVADSRGNLEAIRTITLAGEGSPDRLSCDVPGTETENLECRVINDQTIELSQVVYPRPVRKGRQPSRS
jgi:hypothetical protein